MYIISNLSLIKLILGTIILGISYEVIRKQLRFNTAPAAIIAGCIAVLSLMGLSETNHGFSSTPVIEVDSNSEHPVFHLILIPYGLLALMILMISTASLVMKVFRRNNDSKHFNRPDNWR